MKKITYFMLILAAISGLLLTGCNRQGGSQGASGGGRITFYYWDENQKPGMDAVIQAYSKESGVQVETTIIPWAQYWTRLQTSLSSDAGPDVFWINSPNALDYYPRGLVQEISTYIERDKVDMSKFPSALVQMYSYGGKVHGIPKDYDTIALFYNKKIFDAKGVPYPTDSWTWTDLRRATERLTDGTIHGYAAWLTDTQSVLFPWLLSNNGTLLSSDRSSFRLNSPENIETIQELLRYSRDKLSPSAADLAELSSGDRFMAGMTAMVTDGSWYVPPFYEALGQDLGVASFPYSKKPANVIHGLSFNISAKSGNKEAAWGLLRAFATREAGEAQARVVIPAYEGAAESWKKNFPSLNLQVFIDAAAVSDPLPRGSKNSGVQNDILNTQLANIFAGVVDVAAGLAAIDRECEAAAAR